MVRWRGEVEGLVRGRCGGTRIILGDRGGQKVRGAGQKPSPVDTLYVICAGRQTNEMDVLNGSWKCQLCCCGMASIEIEGRRELTIRG